MDNKLIFENWRQFRHRASVSIHDLTAEEIQAAKTLNEMKIPLALALTEVSEGRRASVAAKNRQRTKKENAARRKEILKFIEIDPNTKVDDLTPEKREEYDEYLAAIINLKKREQALRGDFGIFGKQQQNLIAATEVADLPFIKKIPGIKGLLSRLFNKTDVSVVDVLNAVTSLAIT